MDAMNVVSLKEYKEKKNGIIPVKPVKLSLRKQALAVLKEVKQIIFSMEDLGMKLVVAGTVIILLTVFLVYPSKF
jgi:hypothetical protein